ncbi:hypothetical protein HS088_TW10G00635 [Tripterygium wilfordii]|uniref:Uncharacterized protein n=1 Tax=Tripterygium wilfordii TaxID=458696 RepID=A0A7J7D5Q0_TRIWF|nr:uncharacterized protein LOC120006833 [Tripterygium wilfordii]KAF5741631.1 hypothetical protein HS088_TW10G00635 [Tripterygium wilfordii]
MAVGIKTMAIVVAALGIKSFVHGILAENKKPASGEPNVFHGFVICEYSSDPAVYFGFISFAFLVASTTTGLYSVFYPYKGKSVPLNALVQNATWVVFFLVALCVSCFAGAMLLWATITELLHLTHKVHHNMNTDCPTAKTGLFGGAAFMALNASLFWLISLMLTDNTRDDYFDDDLPEISKGIDGKVYTVDSNEKQQIKVQECP